MGAKIEQVVFLVCAFLAFSIALFVAYAKAKPVNDQSKKEKKINLIFAIICLIIALVIAGFGYYSIKYQSSE